MAQRKKQLIAEGKLDKHGRPNAETPPEYLRALPDANGWEFVTTTCLSQAACQRRCQDAMLRCTPIVRTPSACKPLYWMIMS